MNVFVYSISLQHSFPIIRLFNGRKFVRWSLLDFILLHCIFFVFCIHGFIQIVKIIYWLSNNWFDVFVVWLKVRITTVLFCICESLKILINSVVVIVSIYAYYPRDERQNLLFLNDRALSLLCSKLSECKSLLIASVWLLVLNWRSSGWEFELASLMIDQLLKIQLFDNIFNEANDKYVLAWLK